MLQTTNDEALSTQATKNKKNKTVSAGNGGAGGDSAGSRISKSIKNLSTVANLAKKLKLTKPKRSRLSNAKNNSGTNFLTPRAKKIFIYLQKTFIKALILRHFDPQCYIWIEIDALGYAIGEVLTQMTLDHSAHSTNLFPIM